MNVTGSPMSAPATEEAIGGNISAIGNVTLSVDQPVYRVGEEVRGRFLFGGTLSVYQLITIRRMENGTWNRLGQFTFNGSQYVCCGMYPPCEEFQASESSPILITWNQKIAGGSLPVIPPANVTWQPAGPGAYRLEVMYGKSSCMEGSIEAEFIIR